MESLFFLRKSHLSPNCPKRRNNKTNCTNVINFDSSSHQEIFLLSRNGFFLPPIKFTKCDLRGFLIRPTRRYAFLTHNFLLTHPLFSVPPPYLIRILCSMPLPYLSPLLLTLIRLIPLSKYLFKAESFLKS